MSEDEIIAVVQACKEGKRIERRSHAQLLSGSDWKPICGHPMWNFADFDYRVVEPKWRDATIDDLKHAPLPCRVRDIETLAWTEDRLIGYMASGVGLNWMISGECRYQFCQVREQ